jgi:hypothetical protein
MLKTAKYSSVLETLDKKKKSAVLAALLGARPLADNRYS